MTTLSDVLLGARAAPADAPADASAAQKRTRDDDDSESRVIAKRFETGFSVSAAQSVPPDGPFKGVPNQTAVLSRYITVLANLGSLTNGAAQMPRIINAIASGAVGAAMVPNAHANMYTLMSQRGSVAQFDLAVTFRNLNAIDLTDLVVKACMQSVAPLVFIDAIRVLLGEPANRMSPVMPIGESMADPSSARSLTQTRQIPFHTMGAGRLALSTMNATSGRLFISFDTPALQAALEAAHGRPNADLAIMTDASQRQPMYMYMDARTNTPVALLLPTARGMTLRTSRIAVMSKATITAQSSGFIVHTSPVNQASRQDAVPYIADARALSAIDVYRAMQATFRIMYGAGEAGPRYDSIPGATDQAWNVFLRDVEERTGAALAGVADGAEIFTDDIAAAVDLGVIPPFMRNVVVFSLAELLTVSAVSIGPGGLVIASSTPQYGKHVLESGLMTPIVSTQVAVATSTDVRLVPDACLHSYGRVDLGAFNTSAATAALNATDLFALPASMFAPTPGTKVALRDVLRPAPDLPLRGAPEVDVILDHIVAGAPPAEGMQSYGPQMLFTLQPGVAGSIRITSMMNPTM